MPGMRVGLIDVLGWGGVLLLPFRFSGMINQFSGLMGGGQDGQPAEDQLLKRLEQTRDTIEK